MSEELEIIRGEVDGKKKYCRLPIRLKTSELMIDEGLHELNAEFILDLPRAKAVKFIDAIVEDWMYWYGKANEYYIRLKVAEEG